MTFLSMVELNVKSRRDSSVEEATKDGAATNGSKDPSLAAKIWDKLGLNVGMLMLMVKYFHVHNNQQQRKC